MTVRLSLCLLLLMASIAAVGCHHHGRGGYNAPPAQQIMEPGPGVTGPGPGVLMPPPGPMMGGVMGAGFDGGFCGDGFGMMGGNVQVLIGKPEGMQVSWDVGGVGQYDSEPLITPGRQEFGQGGMYHLKLTNIPAREGIELYPSIEIGRATARTEAYFDHNAVPIQFTEEDFDQVLSGNFVTKVIYLPDPEFQELAQAGVDTLVSTRLDPGLDPIVEADRRGAILAIIRLGNKDKQRPGVMPLGDGSVVPASYDGSVQPAGHQGARTCGPNGCGPGYGNYGAIPSNVPYGQGFIYQPPVTIPHPYVAGVTAPQYGMPFSGTPIGLAGPPHIPLGVPAGLQQHVMKNHTHMNIPDPTKKMVINVKQVPGMSYPQPASRIHIREEAIHGTNVYHQPHANQYQEIPGGYGAGAVPQSDGEYCPPGQ